MESDEWKKAKGVVCSLVCELKLVIFVFVFPPSSWGREDRGPAHPAHDRAAACPRGHAAGATARAAPICAPWQCGNVAGRDGRSARTPHRMANRSMALYK